MRHIKNRRKLSFSELCLKISRRMSNKDKNILGKIFSTEISPPSGYTDVTSRYTIGEEDYKWYLGNDT